MLSIERYNKICKITVGEDEHVFPFHFGYIVPGPVNIFPVNVSNIQNEILTLKWMVSVV